MTKKQEIITYLNELFPDPKCELLYDKDYELLIAVMLSAQTTDKRVNKVTRVLFKKYDTLEKLKDADIDDLINIVKELGNYKKKALAIKGIAKTIYDNNSMIKNDRCFIESLPMVGRKTTNVFLSEIYKEPNIAVDTHVLEVSKRLKLAKTDDVLKVEEALKKYFPKYLWIKIHHSFVLFGRYYCRKKNPKCNNCKLRKYCNYNKKSSS